MTDTSAAAATTITASTASRSTAPTPPAWRSSTPTCSAARVEGDADGDWFNVLWDGPRIATQLAPNHESPDWPRGHQQAHLDFVVVDIAAAHERVLALGGTALDPVEPPQPSPERGFRVYADPAGHPFCLCRPTEDAWG